MDFFGELLTTLDAMAGVGDDKTRRVESKTQTTSDTAREERRRKSREAYERNPPTGLGFSYPLGKPMTRDERGSGLECENPAWSNLVPGVTYSTD